MFNLFNDFLDCYIENACAGKNCKRVFIVLPAKGSNMKNRATKMFHGYDASGNKYQQVQRGEKSDLSRP